MKLYQSLVFVVTLWLAMGVTDTWVSDLALCQAWRAAARSEVRLQVWVTGMGSLLSLLFLVLW